MPPLSHEQLLQIVPKRPDDYEPWGSIIRWETDDADDPDCSCGCRFAAWLEGRLGADWCVCTNPASHRVGLLTFEHQGCRACEAEPEPEEELGGFGDGQGESQK